MRASGWKENMMEEKTVNHGPDFLIVKPGSQKEQISGECNAFFSFLLPTRGRPDLVERFFESVIETTENLAELEIILGVDDDDLPSHQISDDRLCLKKVVIPRGLMMGALNNACFEASTGRFLMLANDEIILRTKGWDSVIRSRFLAFGDDIGLIHVNDLLFREKLCTFPFVSRRACLEIGLCPMEYRRYKINDHIYDIYNLLAYLGHKRIVYLPDVIFEHENHEQLESLKEDINIFKSDDNKFYVADKSIIERHDKLFLDKFNERKEAALKLSAIIEADKFSRLMKSRRITQESLVGVIPDSFSYRSPYFVTTYSQFHASACARPRATVAIVTADFRHDYAFQCMSLVKQYTSDFDLFVMDNSGSKNFSYPKEMNKVLRTIDTDLLVLLEDDVFVEPGWLDCLARCIDERTGMVAPLHRDRDGKVSFTGCYLSGDGLGTHEHTLDVPFSPRSAQAVCSGAILIDVRKCGHILMNEGYKKCFFDLVYSFEVWEAGYKVVVSPDVIVTHLAGATANRLTKKVDDLLEADRATFINQWVNTGRLEKLEQSVWREDNYLKKFSEVCDNLRQLQTAISNLKLNDFVLKMAQIISASIKTVPHDDNLFLQQALKILKNFASGACAKGNFDSVTSCLQQLLEQLTVFSIHSAHYKIARDIEILRDTVHKEIARIKKERKIFFPKSSLAPIIIDTGLTLRNASDRQRILFVMSEFPDWERGCHFSYGSQIGIEEGLQANHVDFATIPSFNGLSKKQFELWFDRAREICALKVFDQVWIELVHGSYSDDFLEWIANLAPVRLGLLGESLCYSEDECAFEPELLHRRSVIETRLRYLTHALVVDEKDSEEINRRGFVRAMWWPQAVPRQFIHTEASYPKVNIATFQGAIYGDRKTFLKSGDLRHLLLHTAPPEYKTDIPKRFNALNQWLINCLNNSRVPKHESIFSEYLNSLRYIRKESFSLWLRELQTGSTVVNLPHFVKAYPGRVSEGMAAGRPVVSWAVPNRPRNLDLFENGEEILLYSDEPMLAEHLKRLKRDPDLAQCISMRARNKIIKFHTIEKRIEQVLQWVQRGEEPFFGVNKMDRPKLNSSPIGYACQLPESIMPKLFQEYRDRPIKLASRVLWHSTAGIITRRLRWLHGLEIDRLYRKYENRPLRLLYKILWHSAFTGLRKYSDSKQVK